MPTYTCFARRHLLTSSHKLSLARAITRAHAEVTGAPAHYAQVMFLEVPDDDHFVGGAPLAHDQLFVSGQIRAGRSLELREVLIRRIVADVAVASGLEPSGVWVYLLELPAAAMVEYGEILPEPGREAEWNPILPPAVRAMVRAGSTPTGDLSGAAAPRPTAATAMPVQVQIVPLPFERHQLVVPQQLSRELDRIVDRVRHQKLVLDDWGLRRRTSNSRGVAALFAGPSGTGKTMAAQVLARELGRDLYRVDLSRITSKYVGETGKNLRQIFDAAAHNGAILLFDEADALFGKRIGIEDSHDRYANVEAGCLLQRLEAHEGLTILTANRRQSLDEAFLRRLRFVVEFPLPTEAERRRIWDNVLPASPARDADVDMHALARSHELSGGGIADAALEAAYLAAAEGVPIGMRHLDTAIRHEIANTLGGRTLAD
jgi:phenylpyruvate tautomerase PptA (4-oxalocrotonate tautomerase family)